jgi:ketosteroid isomerase-like protein
VANVTSESLDFERFMKQRHAAAQAYVSGDAGPLEKLSAKTSDATFFGPRGGHTHGAREVAERYLRDAKAFAVGSETEFEILHMGASDGIGYWVGHQRAKARMQGQDQPVPMNLRITEIFRREGDAWKLVHRHADLLATESK